MTVSGGLVDHPIGSTRDVRPLDQSLLDYHHRTFFCFLPNVCNAKCAFCYVTPAHGSNSWLPKPTLDRTAHLLNAMFQLGFEEVRFTGGEPLVLKNFADLSAAASAAGLKYALLTNGSLLRDHIEHLIVNRPSKVTVSLHTIKDPSAVFGVGWDIEGVLAAMRELNRNGVRVAASAVYASERDDEIRELIDAVADFGVSEFKLIYPNTPYGANAQVRRKYLALLQSGATAPSRSIRMRATDLGARDCMLRDRGHFSVTLPRFDVYGCCVQVGTVPMARLTDMSRRELSSILTSEFDRSASIDTLECSSHIGSCPVSLGKM